MKNNVLPRCKRTRWHSVIRDSSIQRLGGVPKTRQSNRQNPLYLDGRRIKGEGENDATLRPNSENPDSYEPPRTRAVDSRLHGNDESSCIHNHPYRFTLDDESPDMPCGAIFPSHLLPDLPSRGVISRGRETYLQRIVSRHQLVMISQSRLLLHLC